MICLVFEHEPSGSRDENRLWGAGAEAGRAAGGAWSYRVRDDSGLDQGGSHDSHSLLLRSPQATCMDPGRKRTMYLRDKGSLINWAQFESSPFRSRLGEVKNKGFLVSMKEGSQQVQPNKD